MVPLLTFDLPVLILGNHWTLLVCGLVLLSVVAGWIGKDLPRIYTLLSEHQRIHKRDLELQERLQDANREQEVLVQQLQELLAEVDRLYREQAQAAITDAITGLPNHRAVMNRISEELARCQRAQSSCAVLFVDLDHFKRVNDTWGHRAGDAILRDVGSRLHGTLRQEDFVGRYGGEEFAVVLTGIDLRGAHRAAERLRMEVSLQPYLWETEDLQSIVPISVTASIGVAVYQLHGVTREEMVERADQAMYQAKHLGRNRVCIADVEGEPVQEREGRRDSRSLAEASTLQALTAVISAHDHSTSTHAQHMVQLVEDTARLLRRSEEEIYLLRLATVLHDIGKIGIPDTILHKPGALTEEEWATMRRHPKIGQEILRQAGGVFERLSQIVVAHHERWDGRGYPYGLAKEAIPLSARILAVADSFDAMTSLRPYRQPMSVIKARDELQRCAGSQFDPHIVEALLRVIDERQEVQLRVEELQEGVPVIEGQRALTPGMAINGETSPQDAPDQQPARA